MSTQIDGHMKPKIAQNLSTSKTGQTTPQQVPVGVSNTQCSVVQSNKKMFDDLPPPSGSTSKNPGSLSNFQVQMEQRKVPDEEKIKTASETINHVA